VACFAAPWLARGLLLYEKRLALAPIDLRGAFADASVALLVVGVAGLFLSSRHWWGRALALGAVVSFVWMSFAMYEFISVFDSLYAFSHAGFLADSTFAGGSIRHMHHPLVLFLVTTLAVAGAVWARAPRKLWWRWWGAAFASCAFAQLVIPTSHAWDEWRQRHAIQANLSILAVSAGVGSPTVSADVRDVFQSNLRGERWVGPLADRPNVLLIMVEAASGAYLPSVAAAQGVQSAIAMPKLDVLAQRHILFTGVI